MPRLLPCIANTCQLSVNPRNFMVDVLRLQEPDPQFMHAQLCKLVCRALSSSTLSAQAMCMCNSSCLIA